MMHSPNCARRAGRPHPLPKTLAVNGLLLSGQLPLDAASKHLAETWQRLRGRPVTACHPVPDDGARMAGTRFEVSGVHFKHDNALWNALGDSVEVLGHLLRSAVQSQCRLSDR
jgi:hypothetical protein